VADGVVALVLAGVDLSATHRPTCCDPAVGGGAFLLAVAHALTVAGYPPRVILEELLWGADIDPEAVATTRAALRQWGADRGVDVDPGHLAVADTLIAGAGAWPDAPVGGFDVVVGNPPFQSQLATSTARDAQRLATLRRSPLLSDLLAPVTDATRGGSVSAGGYVDTAALFLVVGGGLARAGGRVAMILPESILAARDSGRARRAAAGAAALTGLWWAGEPVVEAGVAVWAPVLELGGVQPKRCALWRGRSFDPAPSAVVDRTALTEGAPWSPLLAGLRGAPPSPLGDGPTLGALATSTAGFRDQFYGAAPFVVESDPAAGPEEGWAPLVTAGLVDPLRCRWGRSDTRFAGRRWHRPAVDLVRLGREDPRLASWAADRLVPKVVVATQTRVLEAAVDVQGTWWPSVPTIAVTPRSGLVEDLWSIAAILLAPPVSAWALTQFGGAALSGDAIKLSASQVMSIPTPPDRSAWAAGAVQAWQVHEAARTDDSLAWREGLARLGRTMTVAYGGADEVWQWWESRLPPWR
jgi:hypothetical protein